MSMLIVQEKDFKHVQDLIEPVDSAPLDQLRELSRPLRPLQPNTREALDRLLSLPEAPDSNHSTLIHLWIADIEAVRVTLADALLQDGYMKAIQ